MTEILCGKEYMSGGKDHRCVLPENHLHRCICDCGEKSPKVGLKKWAFTPKPSRTQQKRERRQQREQEPS